MISIHADFDPPRYVLWCCSGICHEVLTFIQIGCAHTVSGWHKRDFSCLESAMAFMTKTAFLCIKLTSSANAISSTTVVVIWSCCSNIKGWGQINEYYYIQIIGELHTKQLLFLLEIKHIKSKLRFSEKPVNSAKSFSFFIILIAYFVFITWSTVFAIYILTI